MSHKFFVFPGQGSQYPGMGKDWYENFQEARESFEEASDFTGLNLKKLCFEGSEAELRATEVTQPAILCTTVAIFRSLQIDKQGLYAGHSLGEYSALVCSGALDLGPAARLVKNRGRYMQEAVPAGKGAMAALVFRPKTDGTEKADALCREVSALGHGYVSVANYNTPEQIVISGEADAVKAASDRALLAPFDARKVVPLNVSAPFHCRLMKPAAQRLTAELQSAPWMSSKLSYIANVDATTYALDKDLAAVAARLIHQVDHSVLWTQSLVEALRLDARRLVEVGPSAVLTGMAKRVTLNDVGFEALNIDRVEDFKNVEAQLGT